MPVIHYPEGCKCAYCRQGIEDPNSKHIEKRFIITSTSRLGNRCTYQEWTVEIPTCEKCGKKRGKIEKPVFAIGCLFSIVAVFFAFFIAFKYGDGFWQGLIYCIPAVILSGFVILITNLVGEAINNKRNGALKYAPLSLMDKYGFTLTKPSVQQVGGYYSDWSSISDGFYNELAEVEKKLRNGIFDYNKE